MSDSISFQLAIVLLLFFGKSRSSLMQEFVSSFHCRFLKSGIRLPSLLWRQDQTSREEYVLDEDDYELLEDNNVFAPRRKGKFKRLKKGQRHTERVLGVYDEEEFDDSGKSGRSAEEKLKRSLFGDDEDQEAKPNYIIVFKRDGVGVYRKFKRIEERKSGSKKFKPLAFLCRKDVAKACFYSTLQLKRLGSINRRQVRQHWIQSMKMKKEDIARGLGISTKTDSTRCYR